MKNVIYFCVSGILLVALYNLMYRLKFEFTTVLTALRCGSKMSKKLGSKFRAFNLDFFRKKIENKFPKFGDVNVMLNFNEILVLLLIIFL